MTEVTDSEGFLSSPLGKAFARLNKEGIRAHGECGYTQSEAAYLITADGYEGPWVCFTSQDQVGLLDTVGKKGCCICCGIEPSPEDDATNEQLYKRVVKILGEEEGITCEWDGDLNKRIEIDVNYNHNVYLSFFELFRAACGAFNDANLFMLSSISELIDENFDWSDSEEDCLESFNFIFNSSKEELKKDCIATFKSNDDFNLSIPEGEYSSEEEFLEELDWDEIFEAIHEYCDEQTIREKLARCLEENIEEIDFKKTVKIQEEG